MTKCFADLSSSRCRARRGRACSSCRSSSSAITGCSWHQARAAPAAAARRPAPPPPAASPAARVSRSASKNTSPRLRPAPAPLAAPPRPSSARTPSRLPSHSTRSPCLSRSAGRLVSRFSSLFVCRLQILKLRFVCSARSRSFFRLTTTTTTRTRVRK